MVWPRQIGNQCLLMLGLGALIGWCAPAAAAWLQPLATAFLQASQIVVMPYLITELVVGFGGLSQQALRLLLRGGAVVLLGLWLLASLLVIGLPGVLPPLETSSFFDPGQFQRTEPTDLLRTYLPDNIFTALAGDNFPAVVLFASVLGILLQGLEGREVLLPVLETLQRLFGRLNRLVFRSAPWGILALSAQSFSRFPNDQLPQLQALIVLCLIAFVVLSLLLAGLLLGLTGLQPAGLWRILRGPLALTASSANLVIALPMLVTNLRQELEAREDGERTDGKEGANEDLAPLLSLGYCLPTLGQVAALILVPFAAWSVDRPMGSGAIVRMLITAIPTSMAGLKAVFRSELQRQGLPLALQQLVYLNGEWLYRFEKVLALEGLVVLGVLVHQHGAGKLRWRPLWLLGSAATALAVLLAGAAAGRAAIASSLQGSYRNDRILMGLEPLFSSPRPVLLATAPAPAPVSLAAIRRRGVLRVGVRSDGLPWAYHNREGRLVGYDIDLLSALARHLSLRLELVEAPLEELEQLLDVQRLDLAVGGIQSAPNRAVRHRLTHGYQSVHLALVVPDKGVATVQNLPDRPLSRPLRIALSDPQIIDADLRQRMASELGGTGAPVPLEIVPLASRREFFSAPAHGGFDALLTTAEGGAAWAILHPQTSLLTLFGDRLAGELVFLVAGDDPLLLTYLDTWLVREQARGTMKDLFRHWVLVEPVREGSPSRPR
jgi:proton glutamate symport protein